MSTLARMGLASLLAAMATPVAAHHTFTHQHAGDVRLISTKELQLLVLGEGKTSCALLIPRREGAIQYGRLVRGSKRKCPREIWVEITRSKGRYRIAPGPEADDPLRGKLSDYLKKPVRLKPVKGRNAYGERAAKMDVRGLSVRMATDDVTAQLEKAFGTAPTVLEISGRTTGQRPDMKVPALTAALSARDADDKTEAILAIIHGDGADGHYGSKGKTLVGVQRDVQYHQGDARIHIDKFVAALEGKYGKPVEAKLEKRDDGSISRAKMVWALDDRGKPAESTELIDGEVCGGLPAGEFSIDAQMPDGSDLPFGVRGTSLALPLLIEKTFHAPGGCAVTLRVDLTAYSDGGVGNMSTVLSDAAVLSDIAIKADLDNLRKAAERIEVPDAAPQTAEEKKPASPEL